MSRDFITPWAEDDIDQLRHQLHMKQRTKELGDWARAEMNAMAGTRNDECCNGCGHFVCSCSPQPH